MTPAFLHISSQKLVTVSERPKNGVFRGFKNSYICKKFFENWIIYQKKLVTFFRHPDCKRQFVKILKTLGEDRKSIFDIQRLGKHVFYHCEAN